MEPEPRRRRKDEQVRTTIHQKLVDTGEKERLKQLLRSKLEECGWRDELKAYCKEKGLKTTGVKSAPSDTETLMDTTAGSRSDAPR